MKRFLIAATLATMVAAGAGLGISQAAPGDQGKAGPNTHNEHGLCTAYFNGQKNGHDGGSPTPFAALENAANDDSTDSSKESNSTDEQQISDDVFEYCNTFAINPKGIGGNPELNGRFDCSDSETKSGAPRDSDSDGEVECMANP